MPPSEDRILTTHVGSLPRPADLLALYTEHAPADGIADRLRTAVADVLAQRLDVGLDIVNDGEFGKLVETAQPGYGHGTWALYVRERLGGFESIEDTAPLGQSKDRAAFSSFFGGAEVRLPDPERRLKQSTCTGPITYTGQSVAEAMGVECKAIVDAGFLLQIDAPALVVMWDWWFADRTFEEWHALAQTQDVIQQ